jgi:hypothetical protein
MASLPSKNLQQRHDEMMRELANEPEKEEVAKVAPIPDTAISLC